MGRVSTVLCPLSADMQKSSSIDTSQYTIAAVDGTKISEVATATLINLESPVSASEAVSSSSAHAQEDRGEDQPDSIEASEQWQNSRMQLSTASAL